jgi:CRISPR-associated protein Csx14
MPDPTTLVATLGGQPQIITFTLDLLLGRGEQIDQVVVVYFPGGPRYREAYRILGGEFSGDRYLGRACHLRRVDLRCGKGELEDARTPNEIEALRAVFFDLLAELKAQGQRIHLSLSGGRRIMALTALAAAMQHLTPADRVWHINTPADFTEQARGGAILHAPPDVKVQLIEVPFVPWAAYFPGLRPLLEQRSAGPLYAWLGEADLVRCRQVWQALTRRQQEVLRLLGRGQTSKQVALQLSIAPATVDDHRTAILRACALAWQDEPVELDAAFLRQRFGPFLANQERV